MDTVESSKFPKGKPKSRAQDTFIEISDLGEGGFRVCYRYWTILMCGRVGPSLKEFDLFELPSRITPYVSLVDVQMEPTDFVYRFWGAGLSKELHVDPTGKSLSELETDDWKFLTMAQYLRVVENRKPIALEHAFVPGTTERKSEIFQTLLLPLSTEGSSVDNIVSYTNLDQSLVR